MKFYDYLIQYVVDKDKFWKLKEGNNWTLAFDYIIMNIERWKLDTDDIKFKKEELAKIDNQRGKIKYVCQLVNQKYAEFFKNKLKDYLGKTDIELKEFDFEDFLKGKVCGIDIQDIEKIRASAQKNEQIIEDNSKQLIEVNIDNSINNSKDETIDKNNEQKEVDNAKKITLYDYLKQNYLDGDKIWNLKQGLKWRTVIDEIWSKLRKGEVVFDDVSFNKDVYYSQPENDGNIYFFNKLDENNRDKFKQQLIDIGLKPEEDFSFVFLHENELYCDFTIEHIRKAEVKNKKTNKNKEQTNKPAWDNNNGPSSKIINDLGEKHDESYYGPDGESVIRNLIEDIGYNYNTTKAVDDYINNTFNIGKLNDNDTKESVESDYNTKKTTYNIARYQQLKYGDKLTADNMRGGMAAYKVVTTRYDSLGFFGRLWGKITGKTKDIRNLIAKIENIFEANGIDKKTLLNNTKDSEKINKAYLAHKDNKGFATCANRVQDYLVKSEEKVIIFDKYTMEFNKNDDFVIVNEINQQKGTGIEMDNEINNKIIDDEMVK